MPLPLSIPNGKVLLVADDDYLPALMKTLGSARHSIDILQFSFATGSTQRKDFGKNAPLMIASKLAQLKKVHGQRLKIRLYIEGKRETADRNRVTAQFLKAAGVQIKLGSTHAKGFHIDGKYLLFGSTNLTNQSITKNNETNLLIDFPEASRGFTDYFNHLWKGGRHGQIKLPPPMIADGAFKEVLLKAIRSAKSRLDFSIYFFHFTQIEEALIAAHRRGVKIKGFVHHHESFALSYVRRTRGTAERLKAAGIRDIHYGPAYLFTHSKFLVRDKSEVLLGTGNWLHEDVEVHPQLYIDFENPRLASQLVTHLTKKIRSS